jgi:hypothetical protein
MYTNNKLVTKEINIKTNVKFTLCRSFLNLLGIKKHQNWYKLNGIVMYKLHKKEISILVYKASVKLVNMNLLLYCKKGFAKT